MFQIIVTIALLLIVFGGLFAISLSRGEGKELKKECACTIPDDKGNTSCCSTSS